MPQIAIERKCLQCYYCIESPNPQQVLIGKREHACIRNPPSAAAIAGPQGVVVITLYPAVAEHSVSCAEFADGELMLSQHLFTAHDKEVS